MKNAATWKAVSGSGKACRYPFATMRVGDIFVEPDDNGNIECAGRKGRSRRAQSVSSAICLYRKRHAPDSVFTVRTVDGYVYCTRIA